MILCNYCSDEAHSVYNEDFLCKRHYLVLAPKNENQPKQCTVHQTYLEKKLKRKYIDLMNNYRTKEEFDGIVEDFLVDAEIIKHSNKIYSGEETELYS